MNVSIEVAELSEGDLQRHQVLFASFFPATHQLLNVQYLQWLYFGNPVGTAKCVIAHEAGAWIGFMALIPTVLERADENLKAYFVVNVLVHPDHQGKHIFGKMIAVAREFARDEGAAMMGHPNALATGQWKRSKMDFHRQLRPMLLRPGLANFMTHRRVYELSEEWKLWDGLAQQRRQSREWQVKVSAEFLTWRFLRHPTKSYRLYAAMQGREPLALHATIAFKWFVELLLDSYALAGSELRSLRALSWPTISLRPDGLGRQSSGFFPLPVSKRVPFFLTRDREAIKSEQVLGVGLTASDF